MRRIRFIAVAVVAALCMSVVAAASASAHEFVASKAGKTKSSATSNQVFNTGSGNVTCTKLAGKGEVKETELKSETHKETVTYSGCTAFGFVKVKITAAKYKFNANGSVELENEVTITPEGAGCTVKVAGKQVLSSVSFANEAGKINETSNVKGIHSVGSGGVCGGTNTEGTYTGSALTELEGGTIEWK